MQTIPYQSLQLLMQEHDVILRVLACLEALIEESEREGRVPHDEAARLLEFVGTFADSCHHMKEEDTLFPALTERGFPSDRGPIAIMLEEHVAGRTAVGAMRDALDAAGEGDASELARFQKQGRYFVELLREHIGKENEILYPMAAGFLDAEADAELLAKYAKAESSFEPGTHARMLTIAEELCARFKIDAEAVLAQARASGCAGGCGHHD